jgi:hypothetical protein
MRLRENFNEKLQQIVDKTGKMPLSEEEILLLTCQEITSSYSRDEKDYR